MLSIGKQALEQIVTIGSRKVTSLSIGKNQAKVLNYAKAALTEAAVLNASSSGTMLCRTVFTVINKGSADSLVITWTITVG